ncbi:SUKH-4 family immunity protein [Streptacidiphilus anmyonensis]|uniref:SUKH-4 family immunity protein n=1 Tax=Streptacidiphilus anmyonensis TaxID=405782 RepID=UPI00136497FE|nr:SUKH-4 family immunity protein [Streptacidiphilus anmyonensis]
MKSDQGVEWTAVQEELRRVLSQPVERLIVVEDQLLIPEAEGWGIPDSDRRALSERGLPRLPLFTARPQFGADPALVPNRAGPQERRLVNDGQRLYDLGFWGPRADSFVVGVVPGDGRVLCLLPAPVTAEDIPKVLRPYHAGLHKPAVSFFSSSVAQYVETAWRWYSAIRIIRRAGEPAPTAPEEAVVHHYDRLYGCVELIVDAARRLDPVGGVRVDAPESVWVELIRANSV